MLQKTKWNHEDSKRKLKVFFIVIILDLESHEASPRSLKNNITNIIFGGQIIDALLSNHRHYVQPRFQLMS